MKNNNKNSIKEFFNNLFDTITFRVGKKSTKSVAFAGAGCLGNIFVGLGKIIVGIFSHSLFACVSGLYTFSMLVAKTVSLYGIIKEEDIKKQYNYYRMSGMILMFASVLYIAYSIFQFFNPPTATYSIYVALTIASFTFFEIGLNICGIIREKKNKTPLVHGIKIINFAASLISLVLTQSALLTLAENPIISSSFNGLLGIIMGCFAFLLAIYMIVHIKNLEKMKTTYNNLE